MGAPHPLHTLPAFGVPSPHSWGGCSTHGAAKTGGGAKEGGGVLGGVTRWGCPINEGARRWGCPIDEGALEIRGHPGSEAAQLA